MMRGRILGVVVAGAIAGCGRAPEPPPRLFASPQPPSVAPSASADRVVDAEPSESASAAPPGPRQAVPRGISIYTPRGSAVAGLRPKLDAIGSIDVAALPVAVESSVGTLTEGARFQIARLDQTARNCPPRERPRTKITWLMPKFWSEPAIVRIGERILPRQELLDGRFEDPFGMISTIDPSLIAPAEWIGIDRAHRTRDSISVVRFAGRFAQMAAHADRMWKVDAVAIVPDTLYAFRRCTPTCDSSDPAARTDVLEIVGPRALWEGSSGPSDHQRLGNDLAFGDVSAPLVQGGSSTVMIDFSEKALHELRGDAKPSDRGDQVSTYMVDVVWPEGGVPDVTLYAGVTAGDPALGEPAPRDYESAGPACESLIEFIEPFE